MKQQHSTPDAGISIGASDTAQSMRNETPIVVRGQLVDDSLIEEVRAHSLGHRYYQGFLLGAERHVVSAMRRANTSEARAAELIESVSPDYRALMENYFRRQATLGPMQRGELLGPLSRLRITDALTVRTIAPDLLAGGPTSAVVESSANGAKAGGEAGVSAIPDKLRLMLDWYKVEDAQDGWPGTAQDEVVLGLVAVDETGDVHSKAHNIGKIKKGQTKHFHNGGLKLVGFDMTEGSKFPKAYSVTLYAIDRDDGGYNQFLASASNYAKQQLTEEMIARGITTYTQGTLPPERSRLGFARRTPTFHPLSSESC
jgi:hypothetical protein